MPATAQPTQQILTIDPATQQIVQTRVQPSQPVVQAQAQQLMTVDQAGNFVAVPSPNLGMVASNAGVQGIAGLMPGVQVLSSSGQVLQQVGSLQPQPVPSPVVQRGTVVAQLQGHPPPTATPVLQQQQRQPQQRQLLPNQGQITPQPILNQNQPVANSGANIFDTLAASELMKSMVQVQNTTCTVTASSNIVTTQAQFQLGHAQTSRDRPNIFEQAEHFMHPQKMQVLPQTGLGSIKIMPQSPLAKAALQSSPVVSLQRLKPIVASPLKINEVGSGNLGTINVQKLSNQDTPLQSHMPIGSQDTSFSGQNMRIIPSVTPHEQQKKSLSDKDLKEQLLSGSPNKGKILGPVLKKLTHTEMMNLLTSKVESSQVASGK